MWLKTFYDKINFVGECRKLGLSIWQCPSFLTLLTGIVTILSMIGTYFIGLKYADPEAVILVVIGITIFLLVTSYLIIRGFEELAETNRLKSEFVSIASHQLRTPLTGVKWTIDLIMKEGKITDSECLERIETIRENNERMIKLVNDLLNVSRIKQGRLGLRPQETDLKDLAEKIIKDYMFLAKASNVNLSLEAEENLPSIFVDQQGMELVLRNLTDNAVRYTRDGGSVKIRLFRKNDKIRCEVEDKGVGIPKKDQKKIFQKFFRSQNIMKYRTEGTGLGLFIAKSIINTSKGKLGFISREGKGSTFWFELSIK